MIPPDLAQTTALLDLELKRLDDARREHGWTPWLLLATLAALFWQLSGYAEGTHDWARVGLYWALITVVGLTIESLVSILNSHDGPSRPGIRYYPSNLHAAGRSVRLFRGLKIGMAAAMICWLTPLGGATRIAWIILFGFYVYAIFGLVVGSWTDFPQVVGTAPTKSKYAWLTSALFLIFHCSLVLLAVWELWPRLVASYQAADARIALLAFAVAQLISLLLAFNVNLPLRQELMHLRRQIGLGELDASQAKQKLIELMYGSELSVLLRSRFEEVEKNLGALAGLPDEAEKALLVASEAVNRTQQLEAAKTKLEELTRKHSELEGSWVDLWVRIMICRWTGGVPTEITEREKTLDLQVEKITSKVKSLRAAVKSLA